MAGAAVPAGESCIDRALVRSAAAIHGDRWRWLDWGWSRATAVVAVIRQGVRERCAEIRDSPRVHPDVQLEEISARV